MRVFNEIQRFDHWWLQLINLVIVGSLLYACYQWFVIGKWTASAEGFGQVVALLFIPLSMVFVYALRLETQIDEQGVHYRFSPFHSSKRLIKWEEIAEINVRTYSPILEYGGWGYRISFGKGKAYNVKGNKGIQLLLKNGKKLLIGTQKQMEAQTVIHIYQKP